MNVAANPASRRICVMGLGYIGLPTASLLATKGFDVLGVDVKPEVVTTINAGNIHIREPELDVLVRSAVQSGQLKAALRPAAADVFILAVPTPFKDGHAPDLTFVEQAARAVAPVLARGNLLILESTSPVGTTEKVGRWIAEQRLDLEPTDLYIAHCPERVLPGQILKELVANDRIVGGIDAASTAAAGAFYRTFISGKLLQTDSRTAELVKLAENTYRDVNIAFANELSMICERLNIDVWDVIHLANHHPRVNILKPGPGVGGHCIAVDPWFIVHSAPEEAQLIRVARGVNDSKPKYVVRKVREEASRLVEPTIACLGLAYKADIDDLRESPALEIAARLAEEGVGRIIAVEPHIDELPKRLIGLGVRPAALDQALNEADIIVLLVDHSDFRSIDQKRLDNKIVLDTRGIWR